MSYRAIALVVALATACGGGGSPATPTNPVTPVSPAPALAGVTVSLAPSPIQVGQTATATAAGFDQLGAPFGIGAPTWTSAPAGVAAVSAGGVVSGVAPGQATISASVNGKTGKTTIVVVPVPGPGDPVADLIVSPFNAVLTKEETLQLTAIPKDAYGSTLAGRSALWTSSAPSVVSVTGDGLVTALSLGTAIVEATVEGQHAGAALTVIGAIDSTIVVSIAQPVRGSIAGDTLSVYATVQDDFPLTSVVASVGSIEVALSAIPAGAMGFGVAWVGRLDISLLRFGPYTATVIATDSRDHRGLSSVTFVRDTRQGGAAGTPASGSKQALPRVPPSIP